MARHLVVLLQDFPLTFQALLPKFLQIEFMVFVQ